MWERYVILLYKRVISRSLVMGFLVIFRGVVFYGWKLSQLYEAGWRCSAWNIVQFQLFDSFVWNLTVWLLTA
jgi:hypothetical protein